PFRRGETDMGFRANDSSGSYAAWTPTSTQSRSVRRVSAASIYRNGQPGLHQMRLPGSEGLLDAPAAEADPLPPNLPNPPFPVDNGDQTDSIGIGPADPEASEPVPDERVGREKEAEFDPHVIWQ